MEISESQRESLQKFIVDRFRSLGELDEEDITSCLEVTMLSIKSGDREKMKNLYLPQLKDILGDRTDEFISDLLKEMDRFAAAPKDEGAMEQEQHSRRGSEQEKHRQGEEDEYYRDYLLFSDGSEEIEENHPRRLTQRESVDEGKDDNQASSHKGEAQTARKASAGKPGEGNQPGKSLSKPSKSSSNEPGAGPSDPKLPPRKFGRPWPAPPTHMPYVVYYPPPPPGGIKPPDTAPPDFDWKKMQPKMFPYVKPPPPPVSGERNSKPSRFSDPVPSQRKPGDIPSSLLNKRSGESQEQNAGEGSEKRRDPGSSQKNPSSRNVIYVKNVTENFKNMRMITKLFERYGEITGMNLEEGPNIVSVKFKKPQSAFRAVKTKLPLLADKNIFVTLNPDENPPEPSTTAGSSNDKGQGAFAIRRKPSQQQLGNVVSTSAQKESGNAPQMNSEAKTSDPNKMEEEKKEGEVPAAKEGGVNGGKTTNPQSEKLQKLKEKKEFEESKRNYLKKLTDKLKSLLELKSIVENEEHKQEITGILQETKATQQEIVKGMHDAHWKEYLEGQKVNSSLDFTLIASNLPENISNNNALFTKFKPFGKIETIKMTGKNLAEIKFFSLKSAEKALNETKDIQLSFADPTLGKYLLRAQSQKISEDPQNQGVVTNP
eukprot:TRINITY_DN2417_c0_g2_i4.p1 TRINITY_DN2417_c0_g2~~TRINITY_DN2417_c0_g2_i4.p1  ORF type:complete len:657 (+),score=148.13 TRINITY_DN2417_c0_g2_i4:87-2057(+)